MNILILVTGFPPQRLAGTELAAYSMAEHLARRHQVHIITARDKGLPRESIEAGFHIHRLKTVRVPVLGSVLYLIRLIPLVKRCHPDIVHAQAISPSGLFALALKKLLGMPYVVWCQGSEVYLPHRLSRGILRLVLSNADAVITLTADMREVVQRLYKREIVTIPNGVELERYQGLPGEKIRQKIGLGVEEKVALFVGTLRPVKGVRYLIEAMDIVVRENRLARLLVVGDGEERGELENLAKRLGVAARISFIGRKPHRDIPDYMAAADVFVLPSLSEGFPLTILEAMAAGLPIVTTRVRGLPEIIEEGGNGFLVEPRNHQQIAERLLSLFSNDKLAEAMGQSNRDKARGYSWQSIVERLEGLYRGLVRTE